MEKRTVFVTGADRGLGLEICRQFLERGFFVFGGQYFNKWTLLDDLQKEYPDDLVKVTLDITDEQSVLAAVDEVKKYTDTLDILVNNAGISGKHGSGTGDIFDHELDFEEMLRVINVNAIGTLRVMNAFIDMIIPSFHKLIGIISSEAGSIGTCWRYSGFGYCMSKAALNMAGSIVHNRLHREFNGQVMLFNPGGMPSYLGTTQGPDDEMITKPLREGFTNAKTSAEGIVRLLLEQEHFKSDHPAYLQYGGNSIPW